MLDKNKSWKFKSLEKKKFENLKVWKFKSFVKIKYKKIKKLITYYLLLITYYLLLINKCAYCFIPQSSLSRIKSLSLL